MKKRGAVYKFELPLSDLSDRSFVCFQNISRVPRILVFLLTAVPTAAVQFIAVLSVAVLFVSETAVYKTA